MRIIKAYLSACHGLVDVCMLELVWAESFKAIVHNRIQGYLCYYVWIPALHFNMYYCTHCKHVGILTVKCFMLD